MKSKVYRIIDVNINRAVEGIRVIEEIARFVLEDKKSTTQLKQIRAKLRQTTHLKERRSLEDVGRELYTKSEGKRETILDIFSANAKRVQEALRVLEEFSKLSDPRLGKSFKAFRFKVYELEKQMLPLLVRQHRLDFDLYVISDTAKQSIVSEVKIIQLRDKTSTKGQILKQAKMARQLTKRSGTTFIVNDYVDLAVKSKADGVHLGQEDISVRQARRKLGKDKINGDSTHNYKKALAAERAGADYIAVGPVFSTPTKPDAKAVGLKLLQQVVKRVKVPVVAIGGINPSNIKSIIKTGCGKVAVVRAGASCRAIKKLRRQLQKY